MTSAFRVSICGGGIGGLALALVISKYSTLPVEIFEAGPTVTTIGAGIGLYARTFGIMMELGLYDEIVKLAINPPQENTGPRFRKSDQRDGYYWFTRELKGGFVMLHRKDLVELLLRQIPPSCKIHTSKKLEFYEVDPKTEKITLRFADGSSVVTDVLVGADGLHSATRETMYKNLASLARGDDTKAKLLECIDPVWTGTLVYRNLVPTEKYQNEHPDIEVPPGVTFYLGKKKHVVTYPISQGRLINAVFIVHNDDAFGMPFEGRWVTEVSGEEILHQFEDWDVIVRSLVKCCESPLRWALHSVQPLPHYVDGKVALLGDSAHAMEPHLGAGAEQALEDAFVLGRLLTHEWTNLGNVNDALEVYEEVRLPFVNSLIQRSRDMGRYFTLPRVSDNGTILQFDPSDSPEELDRLRKVIEDAWEWRNDCPQVWAETEKRWREKCRGE